LFNAKFNINEMDDVRFIIELDFYNAISLRHQSAGRHDAPLAYIFLIPSQPVFALSHLCCVLSRETTNTNFIVIGLT
jgi:hypothetical protein